MNFKKIRDFSVRKSQIIFSFLFLISCQTGHLRSQANWVELDSSADLSCADWQALKNHFAVVRDMYFAGISNQEPGVVVTGRARSGQPLSWFVRGTDFKKTDVDATLQFFADRGHQVKGSCGLELVEQSFSGVRLDWGRPVKGGCLLGGYGEDGFYHIRRFAHSASVSESNYETLALPKELRGRNLLSMFPGKTENEFILAGPMTRQGDRQTIQWARFSDLTLKKIGEIQVEVSEDPESYDVSIDGDVIHLAMITGDSLIGAARIEFVQYAMDQGRIMNQDSMVIPDAHVGEIRIVSPSSPASSMRILVPKWVDREATIGTYTLQDGGKLGRADSFGLFPGPIAILDATPVEGGIGLILRERSKETWQFRLCKIPLST